MKTRLITSLVALAFFIPVLIFSDTVVYTVAVVLFTALALFELFNCMKLTKNLFVSIPSAVYALGTVACVRSFGEGYMQFFTFCTVGYIFCIFGYTVFRKDDSSSGDIFSALAFTVYMSFGFASLVLVRDHSDFGKYLFLLPYMAAWMSDIGAYLVGTVLGKHKLIPSVSPRKTWEGFFGGLLFCVAVFMLYSLGISLLAPNVKADYVGMLTAAVITSLASTLGDLIASKIKRQNHIKDFSRIFPGHGGMLDRFDSILASGTVFYIISNCTQLICWDFA